MATTDSNTPHAAASTANFFYALGAPFNAIGRALVRAADNSAPMQEVRRLQDVSDEQLAARGTTRTAEIRRILASTGAI